MNEVKIFDSGLDELKFQHKSKNTINTKENLIIC